MTSVIGNFRGSCHCAAIGFSFQTRLSVDQWSVRACQCQFCRAHGALTTSDPTGRLVFRFITATKPPSDLEDSVYACERCDTQVVRTTPRRPGRTEAA